jgi:CRP-like cAMP-binding protein
MNGPIDIEAVRAFRSFQTLSDEDAQRLAWHLQLHSLAPGQALFGQGEAGDSAYLLVSGQMEVRVHVPGSEDYRLATLNPGTVLGEISLLTYEPRSATAVAVSPVEVWQISRDALHQAVLDGDAWASRFLMTTAQALADRLATVDRQLVELIAEKTGAGEVPEVGGVMELERLREYLFSECPI